MIENINTASIVDEILGQFTSYNEALDAGAVDDLNAFFWDSSSTVRFGPTETLFGKDSIANFRLKQWKAPTQSRELLNVAITALGDDLGTTNAVFRSSEGKKSRQSQTWARFSEGWRIVAAHVSASPAEAL
ncbi:hypothetical protein V1281_000134 [Nitrobacteraceae bacterium AZCC 2161]